MVVKGAARQRLQSPRSTSTTGISRAPSPRSGGCPHAAFPRVTAPLSGNGQPSFLGIRGSIGLSPNEHPPGAIARAEVGYPDPRDPDTFCREPVTSRLERPTASGVRSAHLLRAHPANLLARDPPLGLLLSRDLPAGPLPALLREEDRARLRPRCLPSQAALPGDGNMPGKPCTLSLLPWRVGVIHRLFPACGDRAGASFTPAL
jgi:hypothetical protein